jgi:hypothetical protein
MPGEIATLAAAIKGEILAGELLTSRAFERHGRTDELLVQAKTRVGQGGFE